MGKVTGVAKVAEVASERVATVRDGCKDCNGCQSSKNALTLYPLRRMAVFPKSANKDTLLVYNIPFESH